MSETLRVLLVAQTPPPYGGQAVMMQRVLEGDYRGVEMRHVRMSFSRTMDEVGRLRFGKFVHLLMLIVRIGVARVRFRSTTLYYPPSGPDRVPMYRDMLLLLATRWMFRHTVFHFQASGLSYLYPKLRPLTQRLFRAAYFRPDVGIRTDSFAPPDPAFLQARREALIPNALEDVASQLSGGGAVGAAREVPAILFVGVLRESKGVLDLIRACSLLVQSGLRFRLQLMGQFQSPTFEREVRGLVETLDVPTEFLGVLLGDDKYRVYRRATVFCLPSYFASEASPVVLIEAMQFALPIVATAWRGIPAMVEEGVNGFLVPVQDVAALSERLSRLLREPTLAQMMGANGRTRYEDRFTLDAFRESVQQIFDEIADRAHQ